MTLRNATSPTAALYVHVPFCEKRCSYCDFYTVAGRRAAIPAYIEALLRELTLYARRAPWRNLRIDTVYFGGGTPSLLSAEQIHRILARVRADFSLKETPEITLEANPGTTGMAALQGYAQAGVNRLSIGVQSFHAEDLQMLDRLHTVEQVYAAIHDACAAGFENISIDLMFALPGQRPRVWKDNLARAVDLPVQHISAYNLTIEPGTPIAASIQKGRVRPHSEWRERALYEFTIYFLEQHGFMQYEVSNYARSGFCSRHNMKYWDGSPYLGLGASAHSFDGRRRFWNVSNYVRYAAVLQRGRLPVAGEEILTPEQRQAEMIYLGLRMREGLDLHDFSQRFQLDFREKFASQLDRLAAHDPALIQINDERLQLTHEGWLLCDAVCAEFIGTA